MVLRFGALWLPLSRSVSRSWRTRTPRPNIASWGPWPIRLSSRMRTTARRARKWTRWKSARCCRGKVKCKTKRSLPRHKLIGRFCVNCMGFLTSDAHVVSVRVFVLFQLVSYLRLSKKKKNAFSFMKAKITTKSNKYGLMNERIAQLWSNEKEDMWSKKENDDIFVCNTVMIISGKNMSWPVAKIIVMNWSCNTRTNEIHFCPHNPHG